MILSELQRYANGRGLEEPHTVPEWQVLFAATALLNLIRSKLPTTEPIQYLDEQEISLRSLHDASCDRLAPLLPDVKETGLDVEDHVRAYTYSFIGDTRGLANLVRKSEAALQRDKVHSSLDDADMHKMKARHRALVKQLLKEVPSSANPTLTIVAGPFSGGKSELIETLMKDKGKLVIDLDIIRQLLMDGYDPLNQDHVKKVREESWLISDLLLKTALKKRKSVVIQTALHRKKRWINDKSLEYARQHNIPIDVKMILRPISDCILRNWHRDRKVVLKDLLDSMNGMSVVIDLVKKFGNNISVELFDFYPLLKNRQGIIPRLFRDQYERLIKFTGTRKNIKIIDQLSDLAVLTGA